MSHDGLNFGFCVESSQTTPTCEYNVSLSCQKLGVIFTVGCVYEQKMICFANRSLAED